ncbi:hypothetical protein LCGC14_2396520 [marine sediment metagenome]|uniref:Uncharacterized protein n=1 Tax=marine sediment metagenome TaxID=412755 RepID=A0A0F9E905_9ZZZZ
MTVATDIRDKCIEIEAQLAKCTDLCRSAAKAYWPVGDPGYTDYKTIMLPISQDLVTLVAELNVLTS